MEPNFIQPDPFEPSDRTVAAVENFLAAVDQPHTDREAGETFHECLACGEVDSHTDDCPVPVLRAWLEGDKPAALDPRAAQVAAFDAGFDRGVKYAAGRAPFQTGEEWWQSYPKP